MKRNLLFGIRALLLLLVSLISTALADGTRQKATVLIPEGHEHIYENWGFAPAIKIGDAIYVSGVIVTLDGEGSYAERYARGFRNALDQIDGILAHAESSLDDVVDITSYHTDMPRQIQIAARERKAKMNEPHPAWTAVGTTALALPEGVTEIKVIARVAE